MRYGNLKLCKLPLFSRQLYCMSGVPQEGAFWWNNRRCTFDSLSALKFSHTHLCKYSLLRNSCAGRNMNSLSTFDVLLTLIALSLYHYFQNRLHPSLTEEMMKSFNIYIHQIFYWIIVSGMVVFHKLIMYSLLILQFSHHFGEVSVDKGWLYYEQHAVIMDSKTGCTEQIDH